MSAFPPFGHKRHRKSHTRVTVHANSRSKSDDTDDDADDSDDDDVSGYLGDIADKSEDECPEMVLGPGNIPIPNKDPACQDSIKRRRQRAGDGLKKKLPPLNPVGDLIDSFARLIGVTRSIVIFGAVAYGLHYLQKKGNSPWRNVVGK